MALLAYINNMDSDGNNLDLRQRHLIISDWVSRTVPRSRRDDIFYIKLAIQCCKNFHQPARRKLNAYSSSALFSGCKLDPVEPARLNQAGLSASQSGELARNNYSFQNGLIIRTTIYNNNHRITKACSTLEFIMLIHNNDH